MGGSVRVQSRKWQLTINNPEEHGFSHEGIKRALGEFKGMLYWCMCDEEGDECETRHTHVYFVLRSACTADRVNKLFPNMHRLVANGKSKDNRAYILKDGEKFNKNPETGEYDYTDSHGKRHAGINFSDTFEEDGVMPDEHQGVNRAAETIVAMVQEGASDTDIVEAVASAYTQLDKIAELRAKYRDAKFGGIKRDMQVVYMFGKTGCGKTSSVLNHFGYDVCYRVTNYEHPFDGYEGEDVVIFEEFRSGINLGQMLQYLDGYPMLLPARFRDRRACFTKVFITTNVPLEDLYPRQDQESKNALYRRINQVVEFTGYMRMYKFDDVQKYLHRHDWLSKLKEVEVTPFELGWT